MAAVIAANRFPQVSLLIGPPGVGKQRLALWVAQTLLCEARAARGPCGRCSACRRVLDLSHPDVHWFIPIPRPKAPDPSKQIDEADSLLGEVIAARRLDPSYERPEGTASHSLASIRLLQRRVSLTPALASKKVVVLGDAERMVVQEASPEAANAMLKVLEEPPADTVIMLTASEPQALLPTIRSRVVSIRVNRLPDEIVQEFLEAIGVPASPARERRVLLAEGSIGRALSSGSGIDAAEVAADRFLAAVRGGPGKWALAALAQPPWAARGDFTALLDGLAVRLRSRVVEAPQQNRVKLRRYLAALRRVELTRWDAQGNLNPQLALAVLAQELRDLL
ncbi:MAG: DNA polymerase III subunit [Gemmatimonadetes bacterium]|nr:DNA polymerase III subunit [Gemmatimonadota bacterium]